MGTSGIIACAIKPTKLVLGFDWGETKQPLLRREGSLITFCLADGS